MKKYLILIISTLLVFSCTACSLDGNKSDTSSSKSIPTVTESSKDTSINKNKSNQLTDETNSTSSNQTLCQKNALGSAKQYLSSMSFSRDNLIHQLEFDGFTNEQAIYGVQANGY